MDAGVRASEAINHLDAYSVSERDNVIMCTGYDIGRRLYCMKNEYKIKIQSFTRSHLSRGAGESGSGPVTAALRATSTPINNNNKIIHTIIHITVIIIIAYKPYGYGNPKSRRNDDRRGGTEKKIAA